MLSGDNGIITNANKSKEETEIGNEKEQIKLAYAAAKTKKITGGENANVNSNDMNVELNTQKVNAVANGQNPITITFNESGRKYQIMQNGEIVSIPANDMTNIYKYDTETGYILGVKDEYITKVLNSGNESHKQENKVAPLKKVYVGSAPSVEYDYYLKDEVGTFLVIPEQIEGITIKGIAEDAFYRYVNLESIIFPNTVEYIGKSAFSDCISLKSVYLQEGLVEIGMIAFRSCKNLESVQIPEGVISIDERVFEDCYKITNINIPKSVINIGEKAFYCCESIININVDPDNKKYDSRGNCNAIIETATNALIKGCNTTVIPEGIKTIENYAFEACKDLMNIVIPNSVIHIGWSSFRACKNLKSIEVPEGVTIISGGTFYGCSNLKNVTIPNGITEIGQQAFWDCTSLENITIPSTVINIETQSFWGCNNLININIKKAENSITGASWGAPSTTNIVWDYSE